MMEPELNIDLDGVMINSTADSKVAVMDAIYAVTGLNCPRTLWERLTFDHPEVLDNCETHSFQDGKKRLVVDAEGWEKIFIFLSEYLSEFSDKCR